MILFRIIETKIGKILVLCDEGLIGKKYEGKTKKNGKIVLDLKKYASFYSGERIPKNGIKEEIKMAKVINAVGKESVKFITNKLDLDENKVIRIGGIPHLQIYKI